MRVRHDLGNAIGRVEVLPTAETWQVTAYYLTQYGDPACATCDQLNPPPSIVVSVWWDTATGVWNGTCTGCNPVAGPIYTVSVQDMNPCPGVPIAYQLIVELDAAALVACPYGGAVAWLDRVLFQAPAPGTSLSNGYALTQDCTRTGPQLSPIYPSYHNNDRGEFECPPYLGGVIGSPELSITY